jgi:hypothetical protein
MVFRCVKAASIFEAAFFLALDKMRIRLHLPFKIKYP